MKIPLDRNGEWLKQNELFPSLKKRVSVARFNMNRHRMLRIKSIERNSY